MTGRYEALPGEPARPATAELQVCKHGETEPHHFTADDYLVPGLWHCPGPIDAHETVEGSRCANTPTPIRPPVKEANGHG